MHQIERIATQVRQDSRTTVVAAFAPTWVMIGGGVFPFNSLAAVSEAYQATIAHLGIGASETPACLLLDESERPIAQVAYNGRIFAIDEQGTVDYAQALYVPLE